jgi:hypothetical protein
MKQFFTDDEIQQQGSGGFLTKMHLEDLMLFLVTKWTIFGGFDEKNTFSHT